MHWNNVSRINITTFFNLADMFRRYITGGPIIIWEFVLGHLWVHPYIFIVTYFEIAVEFKSRTMLQSRYIALAILRTEKFKISDA